MTVGARTLYQEHSLLHADAWPLFKKTALEASDGKLTLKRHILREALEKRVRTVSG